MNVASQTQAHAYTAACIHCARVVFRRARRVGEIQLTMIENHVLICRPLATLACVDDVLAHCRITETPEH